MWPDDLRAAVGRVAQRLLGVGTAGARLGHEGEQPIAQIGGSRYVGWGASPAQPVEHLVGVQQCWQPGCEPVGDRGPLLLRRLPRLPQLVDRRRVELVGAGSIAREDVRVAAVHLVRDVAGHVGGREVPGLLGDRRVEEHLEQQVTELFAEVVAVAGI